MYSAHNPVDWYPWGEEAFRKAKAENKPIFLNVGYNTCHWCHVMERESFQNKNIADIMNKHFVNVKVDRQDNPGVDKLYMTFVQLSSGKSGWPMSVFLTPDLAPFLGATYFPPDDQYGKPGFKTVLTRVAQLWDTNYEKVKESGESMILQMKSYLQVKPVLDTKVILDPETIASETFHHFERSFDSVNGGFGPIPKFPTPVQLQFLFDYYHVYKNQKTLDAEKARDMVLFTLQKIALGGIHDHIGNGFHRYSTDSEWHVPHFEKMLSDQAQLLSLYCTAYKITGDPFFFDTAKDIVNYVSRDLLHQRGGFYSSEDADSFPAENSPAMVEGAYYVWEASELNDILGFVNSRVFSVHYNCKEEGNVGGAQNINNELVNKNVLFQNKSIEETARIMRMEPAEIAGKLDDAKAKLWEYRSKTRPRPYRDEKIITAWNALMITGLVHAYGALEDEYALQLAVLTAEFIYKELYDPSTYTLLRSYYHGPSTAEAVVDDYSYLIQALLDLYEATFDDRWVQWAYDLQGKQNQLFYDTEQGGYFHVSGNDNSILIRMKEEQDGSEPSPNAVSLRNLSRLASLLEISSYQYITRETIQAFKLSLNKFPFGMPALVASYLLVSHGFKQIVLAGNASDPTVRSFQKLASRVFMPNKLIALARVDGFVASRNSIIKRIAEAHIVAAYICDHQGCGLPMYTVEQLKQAL